MNFDRDRSYREYLNITKRIPLHYQKRYLANISNGSFNTSILTGKYKTKIKSLLKNNRILALALQRDREKKEELLAESKANANLIMFSRLKLANMSDSLKKVSAELDHTISLLEMYSSTCAIKFTARSTINKEEFKDLLKDIPMIAIPEVNESLYSDQETDKIKSREIELHCIDIDNSKDIVSSKENFSPNSENMLNSKEPFAKLKKPKNKTGTKRKLHSTNQNKESKKFKKRSRPDSKRNKMCNLQSSENKNTLKCKNNSIIINLKEGRVYEKNLMDKENQSAVKNLEVPQIPLANKLQALQTSVKPTIGISDISNVKKYLSENSTSHNDSKLKIENNQRKVHFSEEISVCDENSPQFLKKDINEVQKSVLKNITSQMNLENITLRIKNDNKNPYNENNVSNVVTVDQTPCPTLSNVVLNSPLSNDLRLIPKKIENRKKKKDLSVNNLKRLKKSFQNKENINLQKEEEMVKNLAQNTFLVTADVHETQNSKMSVKSRKDKGFDYANLAKEPVVVLTDIFKANKNFCKSISWPTDCDKNRHSLEMKFLEHCSSLKLIPPHSSVMQNENHLQNSDQSKYQVLTKKIFDEPTLLVEGEINEHEEKKLFRKRSAVSYKEKPLNTKMRRS